MSQNKQILAYLKLNEGISAWGAVEKFHCMDLASRIRDLRKMGYSIETTYRKSTKKNESGVYPRYAFYKLNLEDSKGALELNG